MPLTILGPERPDGVLPELLARHGVTGPIALVSAGWRIDELRDEPLRAAVPNEVRNLKLYERFRLLEREATDIVTPYTRKQDALRKTKERYRLRVHEALNTASALLRENGDRDCPWFRQAVRHLQEVDNLFLTEVQALHDRFEAECRPAQHPLVRRERDAIRQELEGCAALCIAGGHIGVLRNRAFFFDLGAVITDRPLYAWSAGAMLLTERVLLYHDHTAYGPGTAELLDHGFGLLSHTVFLPHAHARLDLGDRVHLSVLAHRLAPRKVVGLENKAVFEDGRYTGLPGAAFTIATDGSVHAEVA